MNSNIMTPILVVHQTCPKTSAHFICMLVIITLKLACYLTIIFCNTTAISGLVILIASTPTKQNALRLYLDEFISYKISFT